MAIKQLTEEQIRTWTLEQKDRWWLENVFRGNMPQLTLRAAITGFLLGGLLSATNLYIGAKTGWSLGVGITSVILAFAFFKLLQRAGSWIQTLDPESKLYRVLKWLGASEFTILENNAMQSIATAAAYMTGPLISSLPAYMLLTQKLLPWWQIMTWNIAVSVLGVLFAFPMKRRFINDEQHPFPEGQAAGVVMDTLHTSDAAVGLFKAKVLAWSAGIAAFVKFLQAEAIHQWWQTSARGLKGVENVAERIWYLPEDLWTLFKKLKWPIPTLRGVPMDQLTIAPALDVALIGAGGLMGIRAGVSLLIGAVLNYVILAPWMIQLGEIQKSAKGVYDLKGILLWSLWPGVACMVMASLVAFFAKPDLIVSAFRGLTKRRAGDDVLGHIEFPMWISIVGIPIMSLVAATLGQLYFGVPIWVSLVGLPLTFVLALVAANSTALTSITPVGATSKITQLFYGLARHGDVSANLATASITAEVVSNSSNLLMDIKPGYMLGAKPRQQAIGHLVGIFSGSLAGTFLFFVLFTKDVDPQKPETIATLQSDRFPMPNATVWKGVAEVLSKGLGELRPTAVRALLIAAVVGLLLEVSRIFFKDRLRLSPVGLGLAFVIDFKSSLCMSAGAFAFWLLGVGRLSSVKAKGNLWVENHEPICAGVIAGAAMMGILDTLVAVFLL